MVMRRVYIGGWACRSPRYRPSNQFNSGPFSLRSTTRRQAQGPNWGWCVVVLEYGRTTVRPYFLPSTCDFSRWGGAIWRHLVEVGKRFICAKTLSKMCCLSKASSHFVVFVCTNPDRKPSRKMHRRNRIADYSYFVLISSSLMRCGFEARTHDRASLLYSLRSWILVRGECRNNV